MLARPYAGAADLPCMTAFAARNLDARRGRSCWHPGDIVWMMLTHSHMGLFDNRRDIRLWLSDAGDCVALAWFYGPQFTRFDIDPDHVDLGDEVLGWIEDHVAVLNPEEDIRLRTADGELAACSIAWADDLSRFGVFEPVGTCPAYRGLRLSTILVEQSMLRLRERGMQHAYVMSSESDNATAYRAYRRSFDPIGRQRYHYKDFAAR